MAELRATPQNKALATLANMLRSSREAGDVVDIPVLGGLGSLLLGKSPEEVEEWSYGNAPMQMTPQGVRLPQMKRGRGQQLVDTVFAAVDRPALRSLTAAAGKSLAKALENSPLYDIARQLQESRAPISSIVKQKGGNWLTGSVEDALKGLKRRNPLTQRVAESVGLDEEAFLALPKEQRAAAARAVAGPDFVINQWIEGPLTKYVKSRMASPEDEVRKLAEQGVLHFEPAMIREHSPLMEKVVGRRETAGFPIQGIADAPLARSWENTTDSLIRNLEARDLSSAERAASFGGKSNIPGDTVVHEMNPFASGAGISDVGFPHLIDELSNALNPASGLPRNLQLTPEAVKNMSMEKAVRHVADINAWRAATKAEANRALAEKASIVREYAENNPRGLRWVELKPGETLNPAYELKEIQGKNFPYWDLRKPGAPYGHTTSTELEGIRASNREALEAALKYEAETMQHCVGRYCPDVLEGRSRIFSLRDAKGEPHVTIEVAPKRGEVIREDLELGGMIDDESAEADQIYRNLQQLLEQRGYDDAAEIVERVALGHRHPPELQRVINELYEEADAMLPRAEVPPEIPPRIVQIKGKQNRAPNEEYLPFVQDFVRNSPLGSQWSDVGDLENTGLISARDQNAMVRAALTGRPISIDEGYAAAKRLGERQPFYTQEELIEAFKNEFPDKFAQGGMVQPSWPEPEYNSWDVFAREL